MIKGRGLPGGIVPSDPGYSSKLSEFPFIIRPRTINWLEHKARNDGEREDSLNKVISLIKLAMEAVARLTI